MHGHLIRLRQVVVDPYDPSVLSIRGFPVRVFSVRGSLVS